jgi:hypothetical protein
LAWIVQSDVVWKRRRAGYAPGLMERRRSLVYGLHVRFRETAPDLALSRAAARFRVGAADLVGDGAECVVTVTERRLSPAATRFHVCVEIVRRHRMASATGEGFSSTGHDAMLQAFGQLRSSFQPKVA